MERAIQYPKRAVFNQFSVPKANNIQCLFKIYMQKCWRWKIEKISKNTKQNSQHSPSEYIHKDEASLRSEFIISPAPAAM